MPDEEVVLEYINSFYETFLPDGEVTAQQLLNDESLRRLRSFFAAEAIELSVGPSEVFAAQHGLATSEEYDRRIERSSRAERIALHLHMLVERLVELDFDGYDEVYELLEALSNHQP